MTAAAPAPTLDTLYRAELRAVHGFLWRLGARESEMEDLAHDVFATAARRWQSYEPSRPARPWLLGIAFRVFSEARRRATSHVSEPLSDELADASAGPDDEVATAQARRVLQRALAALPEERRAAFVLHELEGLSVAEVSEVMKAPPPTTYARLRQARLELTEAIHRFRLAEDRRGGVP